MTATLLCLSMLIYHEARSEPLAGQVAVALVAVNRVNSPIYPDDMCEVVTEPAQFPFAWNAPRNNRAWFTAVTVAERVLAGDISDTTNGALHYTRYDIQQPYWTRGMQGQRIGEHIFWTRKVNS